MYDKKAMFFDSPFCVENDIQAARAFDQAVNDPRSTLSKYPADFALYYLGEYDSGTGAVRCSVSHALDMKLWSLFVSRL